MIEVKYAKEIALEENLTIILKGNENEILNYKKNCPILRNIIKIIKYIRPNLKKNETIQIVGHIFIGMGNIKLSIYNYKNLDEKTTYLI